MSTISRTAMPPGPRLPRALQTLGWTARPLPFLERCRERYGDVFTLRIQNEGDWVFLSDLRDELITLLVAGHETTATSLAWTFERLRRHPAKLERLREEVAAGAGSGEDGPYLDAVIKETLRLRPVLPIVVRRLSEPMSFGGYTIPAGAAVVPCIYLVHRREDVYPQPRAFRPERFLEQPAGTYTWLPFGGGVRRCLGASFAQFEMAQVLRTVISEVRLGPAGARSERVRRRSITLTPERQAQVEVLGRSGHSISESSLAYVGA